MTRYQIISITSFPLPPLAKSLPDVVKCAIKDQVSQANEFGALIIRQMAELPMDERHVNNAMQHIEKALMHLRQGAETSQAVQYPNFDR